MKNKETEYMAIGVDIQNDFCPGGSLAVPYGDEVVAPFNKVADTVRSLGGLIVFTRDWHPETTNHFDTWPPHCIANTRGAAFHSDLDVQTNDIIISKGTMVDEDAYSGFQGFAVDGRSLKEIIETKLQKIQKIILFMGGLATDYCVKATVLDALTLKDTIGKNRIEVFAIPQAMRAVNINPNDGKEAQLAMQQAGTRFISANSMLKAGTRIITPEGIVI